MADVTTALATVGVTICSCVAEIDRGRGIAVMLFHVEGNLETGQAPKETGNFMNANQLGSLFAQIVHPASARLDRDGAVVHNSFADDGGSGGVI
ncbi:hypothetical protein CUMW_056050 [Citrus unshiu]|nr:hypothetical protein CUMW_056050 [Citrus unshiu]